MDTELLLMPLAARRITAQICVLILDNGGHPGPPYVRTTIKVRFLPELHHVVLLHWTWSNQLSRNVVCA